MSLAFEFLLLLVRELGQGLGVDERLVERRVVTVHNGVQHVARVHLVEGLGGEHVLLRDGGGRGGHQFGREAQAACQQKPGARWTGLFHVLAKTHAPYRGWSLKKKSHNADEVLVASDMRQNMTFHCEKLNSCKKSVSRHSLFRHGSKSCQNALSYTVTRRSRTHGNGKVICDAFWAFVAQLIQF